MKAKPVVYIGFNPETGNGALTPMIHRLVRLTARSFPCSVAVPVGHRLLTRGKLLDVRPVSRLDDVPVSLCAFVTVSLAREDTVLAALVEQARSLGVRRCGFIFKPDPGKLVSEVTFALFSKRDTEVCNAIHSHIEILPWIRDQLAR